ncbi:MAG: histidine kinase [Bacillota bacterium]|nr:histidine kinase [Bacillota bacterium]
MDNWVIICKLVILTYCTVKIASEGLNNMILLLLCILSYVCINMLYYIFKYKFVRILGPVLTIVLIMVYVSIVNRVFILLLPVSIFDLIYLQKENIFFTTIISGIPAFFIVKDLIMEYILIGILSLFICFISHSLYKKLDSLLKNIDDLRDKNYLLTSKLDKSNEYENQIRLMTQMEERNRMAQVLHDKLGHTISGSLIQLEAASMLIEKDQTKAGHMISNTAGVLREGMECIRASLKELKPHQEQLGINRLKLMLDAFSAGNNIKTTLISKGNIEKVNYAQWKAILDNSGEALTNILKYSKATSVKFNIEILNKYVKVEILDNGTGAKIIKKGLGITGMEERSLSLGGKLIVDGSHGFSVIMLLPIEGDTNANKSSYSR